MHRPTCIVDVCKVDDIVRGIDFYILCNTR